MILTEIFGYNNFEIGAMSLKVLIAIFFAILFLQSGLDKVFNYKDNLEWLKGHFEKSVLAKFVPLMVIKITILEVLTGLISLVAIWGICTGTDMYFAIACGLAALSLLGLFFGQRMAKDYAGAGALVPYFIVAIIGIISFLIF